MEKFIQLFMLIPVLGFLITLLIPYKKENAISAVAFTAVGANLVAAILFVIYWLLNGHHVLNLKEIMLYETRDYQFLLDFYFDKVTVVYLLVGSFLTFLVTIYSRYYLHRESGYKRFFNTVLFFYAGYTLTIISGNFETLFLGWEILGVSSFLLISFYRDRYLPVKNAIKVFGVYRIGDIALLLVMWLSHHLWHENITFLKLNSMQLVIGHLQSHTLEGASITLLLLIAAAAKSAQFPFSSWLPRAMEGPTPSSAIFYGSLSVHIGVFLLLRTYPFWENQYSVRVIFGLLGAITAVLCTLTARVQSSVKSQVAYSSAAQIGLIFIEIAAGFEVLALIHFASNAFLRTYQLLVSPSAVSYLIREQFYNFVPRKHTAEDSLPKRLSYTIYLLSLKEWNLDAFMQGALWNPLKHIGKKLSFFSFRQTLIFYMATLSAGIIALFIDPHISLHLHAFLPEVFAAAGLILVLKSFVERNNPIMSWVLVIMNHFYIALAISFNEDFNIGHIAFYLSGIVVSGLIGLLAINKLKREEGVLDMQQYYGHSYTYPKLAFVFLLACLGLSGFPITPAFIGEDLIFSHIHLSQGQLFLAFLVSVSFILDGLALIRIYARLFMGPHIKRYHDVAFRSS